MMIKSAFSEQKVARTIFFESLSELKIAILLETATLFIATALPGYIYYHKFEHAGNAIKDFLTFNNLLVPIILLIYVIGISATLFAYLHKKTTVNLYHCLPIKRTTLLLTKAAAGYIALIIPIIITALLLIPLRGAEISKHITDFSQGPFPENFVEDCIQHLGFWIVRNSITVLLAYSLCIIAAVLAGGIIIHMMMSLFINMLPIIAITTVIISMSSLIPAIKIPVFDEKVLYFMPLMSTGLKSLSTGKFIAYIIASAVFIAIAVYIYNKIYLENTQNSCFFGWLSDLFCIILTILSAIWDSLLFKEIINNDSPYTNKIPIVILLFATAPVFYIIWRLIADKSVHIFTKHNLKVFLISLAGIAIFTIMIVYNITGIGKKIPAPNNTAKVIVSVDDPITSKKCVSEITNINDIRVADKLHRYFIKNAYKAGSTSVLQMTFVSKNGHKYKRSYSLNFYKTSLESDLLLLDNVNKSLPFRSKTSVKELKNSKVHIDAYYDDNKPLIKLRQKYVPGLINAISKDLDMRIKNGTYLNNNEHSKYSIYFDEKNVDSDEYYFNHIANIDISDLDKNTVKYLKKHILK